MEPSPDMNRPDPAVGGPIAPSATPQPAVVIGPLIIQSAATPLVGLLMLVVGIVVGFLLRPLAHVPALAGIGEATTVPVITSGPLLPTATAASPSAADRQALMAAVVVQTRHFRGNPNAPVVMIEFSDYQWPYCGHFATGAGRQIDAKYVDEGQVRFGYQHFAFLGSESIWAAEASECADDQSKFWEYHDLLFDNQAGENKGAFSKDNLKKLAGQLELDQAAFDKCLDSGQYEQMVRDETAAAQQLGVRSTPTFLINGEPILGAQSLEVFEGYFQKAIAPPTP